MKLAEKFNVPLIPATALGSRHCVSKKSIFIKSGEVKLIIDKPVRVTDFSDLNHCINSIREKMIQHKEKYEKERMSI